MADREGVERDARNRIFAGRVDVGEQHVVGAGQRRTEGIHQRRRPREPVRLERDDDPAAERLRGENDSRNFRRMMAVVVNDQNPLRLAAHLEAALRAAELAEACGDPIERQPELESNGDGGERVQEVVATRHA